jgi:hypothetical protein
VVPDTGMQAKSLGWHVDWLRFPAATTTMDVEVQPDFDYSERPQISVRFFLKWLTQYSNHLPTMASRYQGRQASESRPDPSYWLGAKGDVSLLKVRRASEN